MKKRPAAKPKKQKRSARNIIWLEKVCRIPEGKKVGQPLKIARFMVADFEAIYDNRHGTRRAIISRGRKNAKSMQAAMIVLLHLCGPEAKERINSQLYSAAQSRDQAAVVFQLLTKMIRLNPKLHGAIAIRETRKELFCPLSGVTYRALSADASTSFGLNPALCIHDELGQVRGPRSPLYDALETAVGAQEEPLSIIISTQARTDADLLSVLIDDAAAGHDPRTVLRLETAPKEMDPFDVKTIKLANPAFDVFMNKKEVLAMARDAQRMPAVGHRRRCRRLRSYLSRRVAQVNRRGSRHPSLRMYQKAPQAAPPGATLPPPSHFAPKARQRRRDGSTGPSSLRPPAARMALRRLCRCT
jgi:phage terminase large subunit-like protein